MIYTLTLNPAIDREMIVPDIKLDQVLRADIIHSDLGGKGFNVSRALLALGVESTALGFIGGTVGEQLSVGLTQMGIQVDFIRVEGDTRINLSVVTQDRAHYLKVNEVGPTIALDEADAMINKIGNLVKPGDWWVIAGSSPPGISPAYIASIIQLVQSTGGYAILDTTGETLRVGCASRPFLIKPNGLEACELTGKLASTISDALASIPIIHAMGPQKVAISLGKTGAVYSDGSLSWCAEAPTIQEKNPIGAGDAMLAGMLWALRTNMSGSEVLRWGMACGAAAASLDGTAFGSHQLVASLSSTIMVYKEESITDDKRK